MCFSTDAIEKQSFELTKKIQKLSIYKFIGVEYLGDKKMKSVDWEHTSNDIHQITTIFLEDDSGNLYTIKPDPIGLKFAKGHLTYKEYIKTNKQNTKQGFFIFILSIGLYIALGSAFIYYTI